VPPAFGRGFPPFGGGVKIRQVAGGRGFLSAPLLSETFFAIFTGISLNGNSRPVYSVEEMMKPNFESVWKTLQETAETHKETEKIVKELAESQKETDRQLRELKTQVSGIGDYHQETEEVVKETARQLQDLKAQVSGVSDNIGLSAEEYFQTAFAKNLNFAGIRFDEMQANTTKTRGGKSCEFDIVLVNHDAVALIEAKHRVRKAFPEEMAVEKVAAFRSLFPEYKDYKLYLGIAGFSMDGDAVKTVDIPLKAY
jgi:hypothetical protein